VLDNQEFLLQILVQLQKISKKYLEYFKTRYELCEIVEEMN